MNKIDRERTVIEVVISVKPVCGIRTGATWQAFGVWPGPIRELYAFDRSVERAKQKLRIQLLQDPRVEVDEESGRMFYHLKRKKVKNASNGY